MYDAQTTKYERVKFPTEIQNEIVCKKGEELVEGTILYKTAEGFTKVKPSDSSSSQIAIFLNKIKETSDVLLANAICFGEVDAHFAKIWGEYNKEFVIIDELENFSIGLACFTYLGIGNIVLK